MDSIINEKRQLHETLLRFPPFYTYCKQHLAYSSTKNPAKNKLDIGENSYIHIADSTIQSIKAQHHQLVTIRNMESSSLRRSLNSHCKYSESYVERLSKDDTLVVLKDLERLGCVEFVIGSEKILISHFSPYEMADDMYRWAKKNYLLGDVETLQFITEGEQTTSKESTAILIKNFTSSPRRLFLRW